MKEKKFYEKDWFIILSLVVFFPVGLYLMWKRSEWKRGIKVWVTVVVAMLFLIFISELNPDTQAPELSTESNVVFQLNDEITEETIIKNALIEYSDDISTNENIDLYLKGYSEISNTETSENTVSLCARDEALNITCNDVLIQVDDSVAKEEERKAALEKATAEKEAEEKAAAEKAAQEQAAAEKAAEEKAAAEEAAEEQAAAEKASEEQESSEEAVSSTNGATAMCNDGSLSYSAHHSGTCSHHGGVAIWY